MSLYLDDEQEMALRAWFNMDSSNAWRPDQQGRGLDLAHAITPLMKRWWVDEACYLRGPDGVEAAFTMAHRAIAERVAYLLNENP